MTGRSEGRGGADAGAADRAGVFWGEVAMAKCAACGKELAADVQRFCDAECRGVFTKRLKHGTRSAPGRTSAKRRRKRGR